MKNITFYLFVVLIIMAGCQRQKNKSSIKQSGKSLYMENNCITCHSIDGAEMIGPPLNGVFGTTVYHTDGTSAIVNEDYIIESIKEPHKKVVIDYPDQMNSYTDLLSDNEIRALVEYIKSLNP